MPPITDDMVLQQTNIVLYELVPPPQQPLASLNSGQLSDPAWSCNFFGGPLLGRMIDASQGAPEDPQQYPGDPATWPDGFPDQSFVNFSMSFEQSVSNHNYNVYFQASGTCYLIQVYLDNSVRISTPRSSNWFIGLWKQLATDEWATAYQTLFGVAPPQENNGYVSQWVTVLPSP